MEWVVLPGKTLAQIEDAAVRAAHARHNGIHARMQRELGISKMGLLRKLDKLGLRTPRRTRYLTEADLARAFHKHRMSIAAELRIQDSTFIRWLNTRAPFAVEE